MRLNQLRDFLSIVEAGSIRAAARANGVSHPAMAKSLRALEAEVGVSLIRRGTRGVVCTPAGRTFLTRARTIRAELRKAQEELTVLAAPGGTVSAGFSPASVTVATEAIARFLNNHPLVRLRIVEGSPAALAPLVRDETLDFAVLQQIAAATATGLKFRALYRDRMVIACRMTHPLRGATNLRDLIDARWLGFNTPGSGGWLEIAFAKAELAFPQRLTMCESFALAFELMARTDAVMPVPAPVFFGPLNQGTLAEIRIDQPLPPFVLGLCSRADAPMTPLATTLARGVADIARKLPREK